ncbi:hypothetical protein DCC39_06380 [Pueribacillus theae]|uniref:Uncharacterized protein n=1 Tax=Pueribacillus theae TaxID=2171751 RepID=A0A2U1K4V6_9BACI|nr:hypothetical protein [Pueribacillus theae]PWA12422.1 hypothetical protein DCC39_06380 [Pueribacillus theae]
MEEQQATIVAIVTMKQENIKGGGAPVFITESKDDLQKVSNSLEKIMDASAHQIHENTMIIVAR